jgi:tetratricopeptide (TPR) repeat protein
MAIPLWVALFVLVLAAFAQPPRDSASGDAMAERHRAAQKALTSSDTTRAKSEYRQFISVALQHLASRRAAAGELSRSIALLEEALSLTPDDVDLILDYVAACRNSSQLPKAKTAAEKALAARPKSAKLHLELGRTLSALGEDPAATEHLDQAAALDPNFENGYALAKEYLKRKDPEHGARIFAEMQAGLGDSPALHLEFGRAYSEAGYPERGIAEFKLALAGNEKIRGGHYSLGAAYLLGLGNVMQSQAEAEFGQELKHYPDDPLSLYQLGNLELNRHELTAAEEHLNKAQTLDPRSPDTNLLLAEIYSQTGRSAEAEAALRRSIAYTRDVARNNYQVQRAHYLLGRLLAQSGRHDEAKLEMKTADQLLKESTTATQGLSAAPANAHSPQTETPPLDPEAQSEADAFESKIKDAVADSYNNLGVIAAGAADFPSAFSAFAQAANWNPSVRGLDANWGRAAFSAGDYQQAVGPLRRQLERDPFDTWTRAALGSSYFSRQKYAEALETLRPMKELLGDRPQLNFIVGVSEIKSGESAAGVQRLEELEKANPEIAAIPEALAEAYASLGQNEKAARERELAKAIASRQSDSGTRKHN